MLAFLACLGSAETHAVLIAGSKSYKNYRHQSDVFTMYQMLRSRGVPDKNIIIFAYDDIVTSRSNPHTGQVMNERDGINVYPGRNRIDYRGEEVTADNIFKCLLGVSKKRNLKSTERDNVLLFFNDHGAPGALALPKHGADGKLFANELNEVINEMAKRKKFGRMLFVIEACESGSVGEVIECKNVMTITASNAMESSRAFKWDDDHSTFLSNLFTFRLFQGLEDAKVRTVHDLFSHTKNETFKSEVCYFGDAAVLNQQVSDFFGKNLGNPSPLKNHRKYDETRNSGREQGVRSWDVFPAMLKKMLKRAKSADMKEVLEASLKIEKERRMTANAKFRRLMARMMPHMATKNSKTREHVRIKDWKCYKQVMLGAEQKLGGFDENSYKHCWKLAKLCNKFHDPETILANFD